MVKKKVDSRVRTLIESCVANRTRSFFVLVGDRGKEQVANLHYILSKSQVKARPSVLWCYNHDLGFSTHKQKRMRQIKKLQAKGLYEKPDEDAGGDNFDMFISSTNIRWCYYKESQRVLGNTFGMLVLQDFDAITPNILCRAIETVEGGGCVILLLRTMSSLRQLYTMAMEVHVKFRTEAHQEVIPRFNERFLLSLLQCPVCLFLDDELNVLSVSKNSKTIGTSSSIGGDNTNYNNSGSSTNSKGSNMSAAGGDDLYGLAGLGLAEAGLTREHELTPAQKELKDLKASLAKTELVGALVGCTRTIDQARAVLTFAEGIAEKTLRSTVALTAGRGRGKSAALGLAMAAAVGYGYSNIFVTSPSPENLGTLFEFLFKGLDALSFKEHTDYEAVASSRADFNHAIVRVNIFRQHRQTIQYIEPGDAEKLSQAELVVIDEAAAIPLPLVKAMLGPYLVFLSSTINGYEGTGRSLSLKLIQQLRMQQISGGTGGVGSSISNGASSSSSMNKGAQPGTAGSGSGSLSQRAFREVALHEPIRYASNDGVEKWLTDVLCLDATTPPRLAGKLPPPTACELYAVDRNSLFSYHRVSEAFLHRMMSLYVSSHYKNSPNDLQLISDAPAHRLFVLLGPQSATSSSSSDTTGGGGGEENQIPSLPDILCVLQVCLEGRISRDSVHATLQRGARASGDLVPWTVAQQFQDENFAQLSGARIVRIATHPDATKMGYGTRALSLLASFYQGQLSPLLRSVELGTKGQDKQTRDDDEEDESVLFEGPILTIEDEIKEGGGEAGPSSSRIHIEKVRPRRQLAPLLVPATEMKTAERLHWLGVGYGLTNQLFDFWRRSGYLPLYLRQTANDLTAEHTMIMVRPLEWSGGRSEGDPLPGWHASFVADFGRRYMALLGYEFRSFPVVLALTVLDAACSVVMPAGVLGGGAGDSGIVIDEEEGAGGDDGDNKGVKNDDMIKKKGNSNIKAISSSSSSSSSTFGGTASTLAKPLTSEEISLLFTPFDLKRLESYARNLVDYHMILDLLPTVARLYFSGRIGSVHVPRLQAGILLSLGLQHGTLDNVASQLNIGTNQVLALFNKVMRKVSMCLNSIVEKKAEEDFEKRIDKLHSLSSKRSGSGEGVGRGGGGGGSNESKTKIIKGILNDTSIQRDFAVPTSVIHGSGAIRASNGSGGSGSGNKRKRMETSEGTTTEMEAYSGRVDLMKKKV
jgi:N-acetyltransferase 10